MRTLSILLQLLPHIVSFRRDWRRWIVAGAPLARSDEFHRRRAEALVRTIGRLGPSFVKLAQVFAGRVDLIPEPYVGALATLVDRVPPVPLAEIEATIERSYGRPVGELFERFDPKPIAAASLGQVHRARWRGEEVVVKVLRPNVETIVARDLAAARRLLTLLERRVSNPHLRGARAVIEEFAARIGDEMDFRKEADNAERIRRNFAGNRRVRVPRIVPELARQRVLVMEYMEGTRIDKAAARDGRVGAALVESVIELYLQMMLVDGLFHADPHPGNLLVAPDGAIVLLDFGMVVPVPRELRWHLIMTVFAAIRQDAEGVVAGFFSLGLVAPGTSRETMTELVRLLLGLARRRTTAPERMQLLADEVMTTLYDWPVVLPGELVYFARTAALIEGLGVRHDPRFNAIEFASPIALRMRGRILASLGGADDASPDWAAAVGGVLGRVAGIVSRAGREILGAVQEGIVLGPLGRKPGAARAS